MVPGTRGRVPEPGPPGLEGPGTRSTPTCIRTPPRSGQSRESAKAGGPADTVIEAAGADPFGDCQVEGSLIGALRACGNLDAALSRAEAASRERPADTLICSASAGSSRGSGVARESARERRDAVGGTRAFERRYTEVLYLRRLGVPDDPGERCGGDRVFERSSITRVRPGPRYAQAQLGPRLLGQAIQRAPSRRIATFLRSERRRRGPSNFAGSQEGIRGA